MASNNDVTSDLTNLFKKYNKEVLNPLIIKGLNASEKVLINNLRIGSPVGIDGGQHFRDSWESKPNYRYARYIHNTKKVAYSEGGRGSRMIPLSSLLEHAVSSPYKGFIKKIRLKSKQSVQQAFINEVKGGL
jgi:hypothetical protein